MPRHRVSDFEWVKDAWFAASSYTFPEFPDCKVERQDKGCTIKVFVEFEIHYVQWQLAVCYGIYKGDTN